MAKFVTPARNTPGRTFDHEQLPSAIWPLDPARFRVRRPWPVGAADNMSVRSDPRRDEDARGGSRRHHASASVMETRLAGVSGAVSDAEWQVLNGCLGKSARRGNSVPNQRNRNSRG